jgi:hypothetical protein
LSGFQARPHLERCARDNFVNYGAETVSVLSCLLHNTADDRHIGRLEAPTQCVNHHTLGDHGSKSFRTAHDGLPQFGLPRTLRITSAAGAASPFDLTLALSQVDTNVVLGPEVFRVDVPRTAQPITLDELKHARPGVREN